MWSVKLKENKICVFMFMFLCRDCKLPFNSFYFSLKKSTRTDKWPLCPNNLKVQTGLCDTQRSEMYGFKGIKKNHKI